MTPYQNAETEGIMDISKHNPCAHYDKVMEMKAAFISQWGEKVMVEDALATEMLIEHRKSLGSGHYHKVESCHDNLRRKDEEEDERQLHRSWVGSGR